MTLAASGRAEIRFLVQLSLSLRSVRLIRLCRGELAIGMRAERNTREFGGMALVRPVFDGAQARSHERCYGPRISDPWTRMVSRTRWSS